MLRLILHLSLFMKTEKYLAFVFDDEQSKQDSDFQYKTIHPKAHYLNKTEALRRELDFFFDDFLCDPENELTDKFAFLDYHVAKYTGHGRNFLDFLKRSPRRPYEINDNPFLLDMWRKERQLDIDEWISEHEEEIKNKKAQQTATEPSKDDTRLIVQFENFIASDAEIKAWFRKELLFKTYKGEPIISTDDFDTFLYASFAAFEKKAVILPDQKIKVTADGAFMRNLMYRFYRHITPGRKQNSALKVGLSKNFKRSF